MNRLISTTIILFLLISFSIFDVIRKSDVKVFKIINASKIEADFNHNGTIDINETFCIPDINVLSSNLDTNQTELRNKLGLSYEDSIKFGYLSDVFADNELSDKFIKIKRTGINTPDCVFADIIVNNESYKDKLLVSGFAFKDNKPSGKFSEKLEKARKLDLVILNHRSNKYHKLDCEYGLVARDSVILPKNQVTEGMFPCKFCHIKEKPNLKENKPYPQIISNGDIRIFLSDLTTKLKPDDQCSSPACKEILNQINSSNSSIDIALYGWDKVPAIYNALSSAKSRGVKLRIVYDISKSSYYPETPNLLMLSDNIKGDDKSHLMHNKFFIFDNKTVITGSMNFSKTGLSGFNTNCVIFINSSDVADIYRQEFEQMLSGKFKNNKSKLKHREIIIGKTKITPLFSPKDKIISNYIIPIIKEAKSYIYIPAFIITHKNFSEELINAHKRGVNIKIILDATTISSAKNKIKLLRDNGISVKVENYAGKVHSKSIIVDDKYIIAGSMNFTNSGENYNDENVLIIEDTRLTKYYRGFFEYLWNKIPDKYLKYNPKAEGKDSIGSCNDGIDNNYDGKIDNKDALCN